MNLNGTAHAFEVGTVHEYAPVTVTADDIVEFAEEYDPAYFHVDAEAAKTSMLGGLIGSGFHTCSLTMRMMCDAFLLASPCEGSPGCDLIQWHEPVRPGDTLSGRSTVLESRRSTKKPNLLIVKYRHQTFNQHQRLVLTMESSIFMKVQEETQ